MTARKEFCGYPGARWVVRFCGEWVGQAETRHHAGLIAMSHAGKRSRQIACASLSARHEVEAT